MYKNKNHKIVSKIIDEMVVEIETLFAERDSLSSNIKLIKEITLVIKELDKLYEDDKELQELELEQKKRDDFLDELLMKSTIPTRKSKGDF